MKIKHIVLPFLPSSSLYFLSFFQSVLFYKFILLLLLFHSLSISGQNLRFYREDILFTLNGNSMETDAVYHFYNVGEIDITTPLFYPFPGKTMEVIDSIVVKNDLSGEIIPFHEGRSGILFEITVKGYGKASYRLFFRQRLVEEKFTYILTSTEAWNRALEFANFELKVPVEIMVDSLSYQPDTSYIQTDFRNYLWKKKDFRPDRDFQVWF